MSTWAAVEFRAMGSPCRIVAPDHELATEGQRLVGELERRWSRFIPTSEICALNEAAGRLAIVSAETFGLVAAAEEARIRTNGVFNPLMLDQLCELGYDRSWEDLDPARTNESGRDVSVVRSACIEPIELFAEISAVRLPEGARFDPGGLGKGMAGDMVAASLLSAGAASVQVELGGDVRVGGPAWDGGAWVVHVDDGDHGSAQAATITLEAGGVATSSTFRRRWRVGDDVVHHLLDPRTGTSAATDLDAVTAVASTLWWAEVAAKVALISGSGRARDVLHQLGSTGVLVSDDPESRYDVVLDSVA